MARTMTTSLTRFSERARKEQEAAEREKRHKAKEAKLAAAKLAAEIEAANKKRKAERQPSEGDFLPSSVCDDVLGEILSYIAPIDMRALGMCNNDWRDLNLDDTTNGRLAQRCLQTCPRDGRNVVNFILGVPVDTCAVIEPECVVRWGQYGSVRNPDHRLVTVKGQTNLSLRLVHWAKPVSRPAIERVMSTRAQLWAIGFDYAPTVWFTSKGAAQEEIRKMSAVFRNTKSNVWLPLHAPSTVIMLVYMQHVTWRMGLTEEWIKRCRRMKNTLFAQLDGADLWPVMSPLLADVCKLDALLNGDTA